MRLKNTTAYSYIAYVALACQLLTWIGRPMNIHILVSISVAATTIAVAMGFLFLYIDRGNAQKNNDFAFLYKRGLCRALNIAAEEFDIDLIYFNSFGKLRNITSVDEDQETGFLDYVNLDQFDGTRNLFHK